MSRWGLKVRRLRFMRVACEAVLTRWVVLFSMTYSVADILLTLSSAVRTYALRFSAVSSFALLVCVWTRHYPYHAIPSHPLRHPCMSRRMLYACCVVVLR